MPGQTIDVAEIIDGSRITSFQIRIFILCGLVTLLDGFDAQSIAFAATAIAHDLSIPITSFGPIFGAGTIGLALGAIILPPLADRYGRRYQIIFATLIFGVFSLATAWAGSFATLAALRFFTGLGVGAAVPNLVPLVSEYAPRRSRAMLITLTTVSWPLGAVLGGAISAKLIPLYGWQSVFYLGGVVPLVLAMILIVSLPESLRFVVARKHGNAADAIVNLLHRFSRDVEYSPGDRFIISGEKTDNFSISYLFQGKHAAITILLWLTFFMNFLVLFFMFNWLPPLMEQAGFPAQRAIIATVLFNLGGIVGGIVLGRAMDRYGNYRVVGTAYIFGAVSVGLIGYLVFSIPLLMTALVLGGFCSVGTQVCGNALAASLYPTAIRSTGVGWAYGIGRIGSIIGPLVGGLLLAAHWQSRSLFLIAAVALAGAACAVFLLGRTSERIAEKRDVITTAPA